MSANLVPKELVKELLHTKVFYYHTVRGWEVGTIQNLVAQENRAGAAQVLLTIRSLDDDQLSDVIYKPSLLTKCNAGVDTLAPDNLLTLPELHNGVLVHALKVRHRKDIVYTNLGELVVAINPFKFSIPQYQDSCMASYLAHLHHAELPPNLPPHPWAVAHRAYVSMMSVGTNHSIIISGESGSGKTESCKTMIKYLCHVSDTVRQRLPQGASPSPSTTMSTINEKVQLSNLVLEAFGNAKTLRNDNSSRFGKLTEVQFSERGQLVGMRTTPFLLERSRVVHCAIDERVFHCFYQLAAGAPKDVLAELRIRSPRDFHLLSQGKCISLKASGVDDAADYKNVTAAMQSLGFTEEERKTVWRVVASVAHLQNVQFVDHASQFGKKSAEEAELDPGSLDTVAFVAKDLLQLPDPISLQQALVESTAVVKGQGTIVRKLSTQKAQDQRDSISKLLYSKLFLWIVDRINSATEYRSDDEAHASGGDEEGGVYKQDMSPKSWIALLDIFGFEDFPNNSFEQFCINLANESLQRHYTNHHFIRDLEDMKKEGITTQRVTFVDNSPCMELLQGTKNSVISILDDCSTLDLERGGSGSTGPNITFLSKLTTAHRPEYQSSGPKAGGKSVLDRSGSGVNEHNDGPVLEKPSDYFFRGRLDDDNFTIRHYASDVKYKVEGFVEKNMDHVRDSSLATLKTTTDDVLLRMLSVDENIGILADLQVVGAPSSPRGGGASSPTRLGGSSAGRKTVASQFRASLKLLMDTLDHTSPHWVRCIRPHARKSPDLFDGRLVLEQLVATGILSTIEQRQRNFPYRVPHVEFLQRFGVLAASSLRRLGARCSNQERCHVIISTLRQTTGGGRTEAADDANVQVGHSKIFLSSKTMQQLERQRVELLDQHVLCVGMFARMFSSRKVACGIIWTFHVVRMQRLVRRTLRIRRCVEAYYSELRRRIIERHIQEQRDMMHTEGRGRPRIMTEEQAEFREDTKTFRTQLVPMIATVLKNIRVVEGVTRQELSDALQRAYWALEAAFADGIAKANEARKQRLAEDRLRRDRAIEALQSVYTQERSRLVDVEAKERIALQTEQILPQVRMIQAAAARIRRQQLERDCELQRLQSLHQEELRRLQREENRRVEGEHELWRSAIGEAAYFSDLAQWRGAPPGAYEAFMREFCASRLPSKLLLSPAPSGVSSPSVTDAARQLYEKYRYDLLKRADGATSVFHDAQALRRVVMGAQQPPPVPSRALARVALAQPASPEVQRRARERLQSCSPARQSKREGTRTRRHARKVTDSSDDELELLKDLDRNRRRRGTCLLPDVTDSDDDEVCASLRTTLRFQHSSAVPLSPRSSGTPSRSFRLPPTPKTEEKKRAEPSVVCGGLSRALLLKK